MLMSKSFSTSFIVTVRFDWVKISLNISDYYLKISVNSSDNVKISDGSVIERVVMCLKHLQRKCSKIFDADTIRDHLLNKVIFWTLFKWPQTIYSYPLPDLKFVATGGQVIFFQMCNFFQKFQAYPLSRMMRRRFIYKNSLSLCRHLLGCEDIRRLKITIVASMEPPCEDHPGTTE